MYPEEDLSLGDYPDDNGTMPENVEWLRDAVVGHKIIKAEKQDVPYGDNVHYRGPYEAFVITLDNGKEVVIRDSSSCCAYTELDNFLLNVENIDHVITGVGTTDGFSTWHIFADLGDVLKLDVDWSSGNPFYYGYGFDIMVREIV